MNDFFQEDEAAIGNVYDRQIAGRLLTYLRPYRKLIVVTSVLMVIGSLMTLVGPLIVRYAIDEQILVGQTDQLDFLLMLFFAHLLVGFVFRYAQDALMAFVGQRVVMDMRLQLFTHLQRMSISYFDRNPVGRLVTRVTNDIATIDQAAE